MPATKISLMLAAALGLGAMTAFAQTEEASGAGLSRQMRLAIRFYEQGDDMQAMDRFMEIVTKGEPSERPMASEYINLITHRMNTSGGVGGSPAPGAPPEAASPPADPAPPAADPAVGLGSTASTRRGDAAGPPISQGPVTAPYGAEKPPLESVGKRSAATLHQDAAAPAIRRGSVTEPYGEEMPSPDSVGKRPASTRRQKAAAPAPVVPAPAPIEAAETIAEGQAAPSRRDRAEAVDEARARPVQRSLAPSRARREDMPPANKTLMRKEIRARLRNAVERSLSDLRAVDGVRVLMRENGDPEAIGIPSPLLFQAGIGFQRDASRILDPLTKLVFALGATQLVILPEGTALSDAKVLDMRRTMGISAHLFNAGVAPPRVRVNLLNTQVDIPKGMVDFRGVILGFIYHQPMNLVMESVIGDEQGPPLSLGVYPPSFRPARGQGVIVEFSVSDPPAGLVSWKFSLLQPSLDGTELAPLQAVVGGAPVFHQIFWNGRQNYFGDPLPPGRYECVLTALDAKNRQRSLHRWIQVIDESATPERLLADDGQAPSASPAPESVGGRPASTRRQEAAPAAAAMTATEPMAAAPSADLAGAAQAPLVADVKPAAVAEIAARAKPPQRRQAIQRPVRRRRVARAAASSATKAAEPAADAATVDAPASDRAIPRGSAASGRRWGAADRAIPQGNATTRRQDASEALLADADSGPADSAWVLAFNRGTYQLTPAAERLLAKAAAALPSHPLDTLRVTGHAGSDESEGAVLANQRAKMIAGLLVNRYQVDSKRIFMSAAAAGRGPKVDLEFARTP